MPDRLKELIRKALKIAASVKMSDDDRDEQRKSFAYGNAKISNKHVSREMVCAEAKRRDA